MKKLSMAVACLSMSTFLAAQSKFTIHGKIELISKSKEVFIQGSAGSFRGDIQPDGSFSISGEITEPGDALIRTDSSGADAIWLEPGEYTLVCKEILIAGIKNPLFRTPSLQGPLDARIGNAFDQPRYYIRGASREETRKQHKDFCLRYLDSIFRYHPQSKVLPRMIQFSQDDIGDEATTTYLSLLTTDQQQDESTKQLRLYFKRKDKMEKEKLFKDFSMNNNKGESFLLSSIKGKKLVLIDFWSSDCFPCRRKHEKLVALYEKYAVRGLEIVSVSLDDNKEEWLKAVEKDKMHWINVSELMSWATSLAKDYFIQSLPFGIWLDGNRRIISTGLSDREIEQYLQ